MSGALGATINEPPQPHDMIDFYAKKEDGIFKKCRPLREKGFAWKKISQQTGYPEATLRQKICKVGDPIRGTLDGAGSLPFGYTRFQGQVVRDPKEYETVLLILDLWKEKKSPHQIKKELQKRKIFSRRSSNWETRLINKIICRESRFSKSKP